MSTTVTQDNAALADPAGVDELRRLLQRYYEGKNHLRRGLCLLASGQHDQAIRAFTAAEEANPDSLILPTYLAAAYLSAGRLKQAADEFERVANREPANVLHRVRHALALWKDGQVERAVASLREGISHDLESAELHFQLATILAAEGETEEAELRFTQAITLDKQHAEALVGLALCHGAQGNAREAVRLLKRAQSQNPHDARTALLLTHALQAAEETSDRPVRVTMPAETSTEDEAALDELASFIEANPDFVEAFLSLDTRELNAEVFAMLAVTINRALERAPEHADLHYHCGCLLSRLGRTEHAIAAVERAVGLRPKFIKALIQLAKLYQQSNRQLDARRRLEEAIRCGGEYADVYYLLGNLYRDGGMIDRAREAYQRALGINPRYADAQHALQAVMA